MSAPDTPRPAQYHAEALEASGGKSFQAATAVLAGLPGAVLPNSRASARHNAAVRAQEAAVLRRWASDSGCLFDGAAFDRQWRLQGEMGGSENDIIYDEKTGRVWKRNHLAVFCLSWRQFFDRILLHNCLFPEAPLRFEGFLEHEGELCGFLSQPDIVAARGAERHECELVMQARGFDRRRNDDYEDAALRVEDLHPGNVLIDGHGELIVIDPAIFPRSL